MYKELIDLLYEARNVGIEIKLTGAQLQLKIQKGKSIDPLLIEKIKNNRQGIIELLGDSALKLKKITNDEGVITPGRSQVGLTPLSFSQERLWFIDRLQGSVQYHIPQVLRLRGKLDREGADPAGGSVAEHLGIPPLGGTSFLRSISPAA